MAKQYFTHSLRSFVKYCFCHEKIKFISLSRRVMFFLLYRHADEVVFDDFPKISDHLPLSQAVPAAMSQVGRRHMRTRLKLRTVRRG